MPLTSLNLHPPLVEQIGTIATYLDSTSYLSARAVCTDWYNRLQYAQDWIPEELPNTIVNKRWSFRCLSFPILKQGGVISRIQVEFSKIFDPRAESPEEYLRWRGYLGWKCVFEQLVGYVSNATTLTTIEYLKQTAPFEAAVAVTASKLNQITNQAMATKFLPVQEQFLEMAGPDLTTFKSLPEYVRAVGLSFHSIFCTIDSYLEGLNPELLTDAFAGEESQSSSQSRPLFHTYKYPQANRAEIEKYLNFLKLHNMYTYVELLATVRRMPNTILNILYPAQEIYEEVQQPQSADQVCNNSVQLTTAEKRTLALIAVSKIQKLYRYLPEWLQTDIEIAIAALPIKDDWRFLNPSLELDELHPDVRRDPRVLLYFHQQTGCKHALALLFTKKSDLFSSLCPTAFRTSFDAPFGDSPTTEDPDHDAIAVQAPQTSPSTDYIQIQWLLNMDPLLLGDKETALSIVRTIRDAICFIPSPLKYEIMGILEKEQLSKK